MNRHVIQMQPVEAPLPYEGKGKPKQVLGASETPSGAVHWDAENTDQRSRALQKWRRSISAVFGGESRAIRVAWALEGLFSRTGYCFATDGFLATEMSMSLRKVQEGLKRLEDGGAILRTSVQKGRGISERRIWPAQAVLRFDPRFDESYGARRITPPAQNRRTTPMPFSGGKLPLKKADIVESRRVRAEALTEQTPDSWRVLLPSGDDREQ